MVLFGMVFVFVVYNWGLIELGKLGWLVVFIYVVGVVFCLVCFNM